MSEPTNKKNKGGRPKLPISAEQVKQLASYGCSNGEIASFFSCDESVIRRRFAVNVKKGKNLGKTRLRQKQMAVALNGNVSMLIWLGKQMLGQTDKQDLDLTGNMTYQLSEKYIAKTKKNESKK